MKRVLIIVVAAVFAALGLAAPAAAEQTSPLSQSHEVTPGDCGEVTLTFTNDASGTYVWNVQTSGDLNENVSVPAGESKEHTVTLEPGEGDGWVSYGTVAGPERDHFLANGTVRVPLCAPEPEPEPERDPAASLAGNCDDGVVATLDNSASEVEQQFVARSSSGGEVLERVVETVPAGETTTVTLPFVEDEPTRAWVKTLPQGEMLADATDTVNCEPDGTPSPDPTDTSTPDPSDTGTPEPTPSETQVAEVENKGDSLPLTGSSTGLIALIAAGLLTAGGATLGGLRLARR